MLPISKKRVFFDLVVFALTFFVITALLWSPQVYREVYPEDTTLLYSLSIGDVDYTNNCNISDPNSIEISGDDAYIVFSDLKQTGQKVVLKFAKPLESDTEVELFYNQKWGFSESNKITNNCKIGESQTTFWIKSNEYIQLRVDIDIPYQLDSVEVYSVKIVEIPAVANGYWWIWSVLWGIVVTIIIDILNRKYSISAVLSNKIKVIFQILKENICILCGIAVISGMMGVLLVGRPILTLFYIYQVLMVSLFFFSLLCVILCLWKNRDRLIENFDQIFAIILLMSGFVLVVIAPQAHSSWDTDVHYRLALEASYWGNAKMTQTDLMIEQAKDYAWITSNPYANFDNLLNLTIGYDDIVKSYEGTVSLAHIPAGIFIAIGRLIGLPFAVVFMMGKLANLLVYTIVCYFGLKKLKSGKLLYAVIALFPTNVLVACSYSYDYWVTGFTLLGMAYYIGIFQQKNQHVTIRDTIVMCAAFGLGCIPKAIYVPLLVIPFILPRNRMKNPKKYYEICFIALFITAVLFAIAAFGETTSDGDSRGGVGINPAAQIAFIFGNIFKYATILLKFLLVDYLNILNADMYISNWSYIGWSAGVEQATRGALVILILLVIVFLFDKDNPYPIEARTGWRNRLYVLLMYFGGSALIATALYLVFNPVASETIVGCQHRYIVPWLYPMLSIWSLNGVKPMIPKKILYWMVTIGCFGIIYYDIFTVVLPKVAWI